MPTTKTYKENIQTILAFSTLAAGDKTLVKSFEDRMTATAVFFELMNENAGASGGNIQQKSMFTELLRGFKPETSSSTPRVSRLEISRNLKSGSEFVQRAYKLAHGASSITIISGPNSPFHLSDNHEVLLVIPDKFILAASDIIQVLWNVLNQGNGDFNLGTLYPTLEQLHKLGYIKNTEGQKYKLYDAENNSVIVTCVVLTSKTSTYFFGEGLYSIDKSAYLKHLRPTPKTILEENRLKDYSESK